MLPAASALSNPKIDKPPHRGRWIPLSVRMFVVILILLGIAGCWRCVIAYQQLAAIREVERFSGNVWEEPVGPNWLRELVGEERMRAFDDVTAVVLNEQATDSTLNQISRFTALKCLWLRDTQVTDAGLAHLRGLTGLTCLNLAKTKVSADGLASLVAQSRLRILWLDETQANDAGRQHLGKLTGLKWLVVESLSPRHAFDDLFELATRQQKFTWRIADVSAVEQCVTRWESGDGEPALTVSTFRPVE